MMLTNFQPNNNIQPRYAHVIAVPIVAGLICVFEYMCLDTDSADLANGIGPILLGSVSGWAAVRLVRNAPVLLLSCLPWVLFATLAYASLGPLFLVFGSQESINSIPIYLAMNSNELLKTNILNSAFTAIIFLAYLLFSRHHIQNIGAAKFVAHLSDRRAAKELFFGCLIIGLIFQILIELPIYDRYGYVPGPFFQLSQLSFLALMPAGYLLGSKERHFGWIAPAIFALQFSFAFVSFSKSSVLMAILFFGIGYYLAKRSTLILATIFIIAATTYYSIGSTVTICREEGGIAANVVQRIQILSDVIQDKNGVRSKRIENEIQDWWLRLNYANVQWFVIQRYDQGHPFDSYKNAFWAFVPRIIVPSKPSMTQMGNELNYLIHKQYGSSMGVGIAGEAYGVGGIVCVPIVAIFLGAIIAFLDARFALNLAGGWYYLPVQVICMRMGFRLDGYLVPDYIGTMVMVVVYMQIVKILLHSRMAGSRLTSLQRREI